MDDAHGACLTPGSIAAAQGELLAAGAARPFRLRVGPGLRRIAEDAAREADPRIVVLTDVGLPREGWLLEGE